MAPEGESFSAITIYQIGGNGSKPFPSRTKPLLQSKAKCEAICEAINMKITLILMQIKLIFVRKAAFSLVLIVRIFGTC